MLRPRLVAIAPQTAEVVRCAGGWLFDRVLSGWDVTVITSHDPQRRPLRILGARDFTLGEALAYEADGSCVAAMAVSAPMYGADQRVRDLVDRAVATGLSELWVWGEGEQAGAGLASGAEPAPHRLSAAARAFKAQAMAAAAICGEGPADTELLRQGNLARLASWS